MTAYLSQTEISSYRGDVIPLLLCFDGDGGADRTVFSVSDARVVSLGRLQGVPHGVLLTLLTPGVTEVVAEHQGKRLSCRVTVKERKSVTPGEKLEYFVGDFHDHTTNVHNPVAFAAGEGCFLADYLDALKNDARLDFSVISDHALTTNDRDFFAGFVGAAQRRAADTVVLAGAECDITVIEEDRYGISYKNAGEIVTVNTARYIDAHSFAEYFDAMKHSPFAIGVLAHPYVCGYSTKGIWNFSLDKNDFPDLKRIVRGVEMGDGSVRSSNGIHEYMYSLALDRGFRVSATCASDSHGPLWGYDRMPGKTVIMAPEKSKEAFLDALLNARFYATESGNVKIFYTVNGLPAASTLPLTDTYHFRVALSYFHNDPTTVPTVCRVISDGGRTVAEFKGEELSNLDFEIRSATARYFYLRFTDREGRRSWSAPVWTSREIDPPASALTPLPKKDFTVTELESGRDASVLVNDNPRITWESERCEASYVIDMKKEYRVAALGHYTPFVDRSEVADLTSTLSHFASRYEIWTSLDGVDFEKCSEGLVRCFSGEELLRFPAHKARYVMFKVLSTTGAEWRPLFKVSTLHIAELTPFA